MRRLVILIVVLFAAGAAVGPAVAAQSPEKAKARAFTLKSELLSQHAEIASALQQVESEPGNAEAWRALGQSLAERAAFADAIRALTEATKLAPNDANAWSDLGTVYVRDGKPGPAKTALTRALKIEPFHAIAQYNLGVAYQLSGNYEAALNAFERAILIDPDLGDPRKNAAAVINPDMAIVQHRIYMQTSGAVNAPFSPKPAAQAPREIPGTGSGGAGR